MSFQSTLPRGERHTFYEIILLSYRISIHAPARGATHIYPPSRVSIQFQSTLPRGERLRRLRQLLKTEKISIHAPARGATPLPKINNTFPGHFNPRSREGSDKDSASVAVLIFQFQSTLPRGERLRSSRLIALNFSISIHAPARGATSNACDTVKSALFQSTLPRGERRGCGAQKAHV